jgi:hypothetical protein
LVLSGTIFALTPSLAWEELMDLESKALHHHRVQHAKTKKPVPGTGQLTYYIFEGVLAGTFGTEQVCVEAWSGGGGGAKKMKPTENANNPYMYGLKAVEDKSKKPIIRGGPIPRDLGKSILQARIISSRR